MKTKPLSAFLILALAFGCIEQENTGPVASFSDMAKFESTKLRKTLELLNNISVEEYGAFEKEKGFKSYFSYWTDANTEFALVDSDETLQSFLKKYGDIAVLEGDQLRPTIEGRFYQLICNRQGYFQTENVVHRVVGEEVYYIATSKDWTQLSILRAGDPAIAEGGKMRYREPDDSHGSGAKTQVSCQQNLWDDVYYDVGGCTGDRKAVVNASVFSYFFQGMIFLENGDFYIINHRQPLVEFTLVGYKKNIWCNWINYYTQLEFHGASYTVTAYANYDFAYYENVVVQTWSTPYTASASIPDYDSVGDVGGLNTWIFPGDELINETTTIPTVPQQIAYTGKSRGVGNQWASVSCP